MTVFNEVERKARKAHRCYNCGTKIQPGETYTYMSGVDEGSGWNAASHSDCRDAELKLNEFHLCTDIDDWACVCDWRSEEREHTDDWLSEHFPAVLARFSRAERSDAAPDVDEAVRDTPK